MKIVQVQFAPWDKKYNFDQAGLVLAVGDQVIVKTELGMELGRVTDFLDLPAVEAGDKINNNSGSSGQDGQLKDESSEIKRIIRKATAVDLENTPDSGQIDKDFSFCKSLIKKYELPMKLVGVHHSFDGSRITFPFIADSRVDFRELVKDLTKHFSRNIRLQQIGIRDEARCCGDFGHCGRPLCCGRFLGDLNSITSEMAEQQQCAHRGSDRISGVCGMLMCCLSFEEEGYKKMSENLPPLFSDVKVEGKKGRVVAHHILKQTVSVQLYENSGEAESIVEVEAGKVKKL